jgi:hypothetical protein
MRASIKQLNSHACDDFDRLVVDSLTQPVLTNCCLNAASIHTLFLTTTMFYEVNRYHRDIPLTQLRMAKDVDDLLQQASTNKAKKVKVSRLSSAVEGYYSSGSFRFGIL